MLDGTALPATLYVQLHVGNPGAAGTANVATLSARQSFTRGAATAGAASNVNLLQWLSAPATEDLTHLSVWSASSAGTCWFVGGITDSPASAVTSQNVEIQIGSLDLNCEIWS